MRGATSTTSRPSRAARPKAAENSEPGANAVTTPTTVSARPLPKPSPICSAALFRPRSSGADSASVDVLSRG